MRAYRFRRPPWRPFQAGLEDESAWWGPFGLVVLLLAAVTVSGA